VVKQRGHQKATAVDADIHFFLKIKATLEGKKIKELVDEMLMESISRRKWEDDYIKISLRDEDDVVAAMSMILADEIIKAKG
jgi:hypothetical protein